MDWEAAFSEKAVSAYKAASELLSEHPNDAASRAYYAVCLGMNARLGPTEPGSPRRHGDLTRPGSLRASGLDRDDARSLRLLYDLRRRADYEAEIVLESQAMQAVGLAWLLLGTMGITPP